jgi:hypothetical protein
MRRMLFTIVALAGCNNPTYLPEHRPLETQVNMMMGAQNNGLQTDTDLYVIPVRRPSQDEMRALTAEQNQKGLMMPVPWVGTRDFDIEIAYSLKNLDATPVKVQLQLSGGNEFGDYVPANYVDLTANAEDQVPPPPLMGGTPIDLAANETKAGVFREDDIYEASLDLEAITRYPDPAAVMSAPFVVIVHNSTASRVGLENIPPNDVTPAMVRYNFSLSANGHVVLDYSVRVRDHAGKLALPTDKNLYVKTDAVLAPPVAPPAAPAMP